MAKRQLMTGELHIGEVNDDELKLALMSVLPRSAQFRADEVEYRTMADEWALSLQYRERKVVEAVVGPAMTSELKEQVCATIKRALLAPRSSRVCRWTLFSARPVEGYWRYRNFFQIVPAPLSAPRAAELMAEHPFVLDFRFEDSADERIRRYRYVRQAADLTLVLNLLLRPRISSPSNRCRAHWVWAPQGSVPPAVWAHEGYMIPDFHYVVEDFPVTADVPPLEEAPAEGYYDLRAGSPDLLTIPRELARLLDEFSGLNGDDRERFLRACFWYDTASTVRNYSQSLYLTSLVNAIECLASIGPGRSKPEGPSALFLSFMRKFAPGSPSGTILKKIYDVRGEVTHGERLLYFDEATLSSGLDQTSAEDQKIVDNAIALTRGALINWLWSRDQSTPDPLLTKGPPRAKPARPGTRSGMIVTVLDSK